jgi:hypothetical protein
MADQRREKTDTSDAELDRLAEITPADIVDAQRAWRKDAPTESKDLLDATPDDPPPSSGS